MRTRRDVLQGLGAVGAGLLAGPLLRGTAFGATAVDFQLPARACDCHVHIFDPANFPYTAKRVYTPPPALISDLLDLHKALRMDRVVIVQPSVYAADNACTLDAVKKLGARARGVAVIDKNTSQTEIDDMNGVGVRGIRLNLNTTPGGEVDADGSKRTLDMAVKQLEGRKWHIQFYTRPPVIAALKAHIEQLPFPVVFDHFGGEQAALGVGQPGFSDLVELVKSGKAYVKISGAYRASKLGPDYPDAAPLAQALIAANADRIVWGTDWPHPDSVTPPGNGSDGADHVRKLAGEAVAAIRGATPIDAIVMASASRRGDVVYTSDEADLLRLRGFFPNTRVRVMRV